MLTVMLAAIDAFSPMRFGLLYVLILYMDYYIIDNVLIPYIKLKEENDENILIHKRPEKTEKKMVKDYIRKDFKTRGEALDYFYTEGSTLYVPNTPEYTVANEMDMLDSFGQLFVLEEREQTWQDIAQEFIRNDTVLSRDQFVEDMFGNEFPEYHEPLKKLAQIIVENTK